MTVIARMAGRLARSRLGHPAGFAALAVLLTATSLGSGLAIDDFAHREAIRGSAIAPPGLRGDVFHLYSFFVGPEQVRALRDDGLAPWWTPDDLRIAFLRPLAAATLRLDHALWPDREWMMHVHNLLWFGALVGAVASAYRLLDPHLPRAVLAGLLFAIDNANGTPASWIANRHVLVGGTVGVLALIAYAHRRRGIALALFAAALLASESAVAIAACLFAYEACRETSPLRERATRLSPFAAVGAAWLVLYGRLGYGAHGSGIYLHPLHDAPAFLAALPERAGLALLGAWGEPPPELALLALLRPFVLPWMVLVAAGVLSLVGSLVRRDPQARFWALLLGLALIPACASAIELRSLLFVRFATLPLVATALLDLPRGVSTLRRVAGSVAAALLALVHLLAAPLALPFLAQTPRYARELVRETSASWPTDASLARRNVVALDTPIYLAMMSFTRFDRAVAGGPLPLTARALVSGPPRPYRVARVDEQTLTLTALDMPFVASYDRLFRGAPFIAGERVLLPGIEVTVTGVEDGRLRAARFRFDTVIEDPKWLWLRWRSDRYVPFTPPAVGQSIVIDRGTEPED